MITEDYVSFETAKLLKERGFDNVTCQNSPHFAYNKDGQFSGPSWDTEYNAPTLQMVMKWLREVHNLEIYPFHDAFQECTTWWYRIEHYKKGCASVKDESDSIYGTYEQACEAAIKYCLENLI